MDFDALRAELAVSPALVAQGRVRAVTGLSVRLALPGARVGDVVVLKRRGAPLQAEIVGFDQGEAVAIPLGELTGVGVDDAVESTGAPLEVATGPGLLGRVLDGLGRPADGLPLPEGLTRVPVDRAPPPALGRRPVTEPLSTGVRVIDGFLTLGVGQRVGLFAGSGVGKSTLLGAIARGTSADVVVVALVGERGREVGDFLAHSLGEAGRRRSVVVVATSDAPALERLRAVQVATAVAEGFRDAGKSVMLLVDSVTRVARAQREVGLAAGEPPARRGYPPSVFALLPRLLERSGQSDRGAITAIYTVLVEGGDMEEPIADEVRGILDGHIVMDRRIAARGHYPAIDVPQSLSRVMDAVVSPEHVAAARKVRTLIATYEEKRDLITLGAYAKGSDPRVDRAVAALPEIERFVCQNAEPTAFATAAEDLEKLAKKFG
ncbi:MAG: FliI/YscN family ATPase [Polyangiaceae bacterium]|nr:FliI/YscN family ATPase [Myxococcales bacterium]MCC6903516.1 FliI/YscN family ATPase [Polyangiaceae bacterium]